MYNTHTCLYNHTNGIALSSTLVNRRLTQSQMKPFFCYMKRNRFKVPPFLRLPVSSRSCIRFCLVLKLFSLSNESVAQTAVLADLWGSIQGRIKWDGGVKELLSCSTSNSWKSRCSFLESLCCCFSSCSTDMLLLLSSHFFIFYAGSQRGCLVFCFGFHWLKCHH